MAATGRPLNPVERGRLLLDVIPFVVLLVGTIFVATTWSDITESLAGQRTPLLFGAVLGVLLLVTGTTALNRVRDLLGGVAVVEQDHLTRLLRPRRGPRGRRCYGDFEHLGTLRLSPEDFARASTADDVAQLHHAGQGSARSVPVVLRVAYSPASKIAWSLTEV